MDRPVTRDGGADATRDNGLKDPTLRASPLLSIDQVRSVVFILRRARVVAFLQRFVPGKYLPPPEDRIPEALLKRPIHEMKKLIPKWKWTSSEQSPPRSSAKLGEELFYAITVPRMSRLELWRAGHKDCVAALNQAYSTLYSIGGRAREREGRKRT